MSKEIYYIIGRIPKKGNIYTSFLTIENLIIYKLADNLLSKAVEYLYRGIKIFPYLQIMKCVSTNDPLIFNIIKIYKNDSEKIRKILLLI